MTTAAMENKALLAAPKDAKVPPSATMVAVARKYGISPLKQMRQMFGLRFGPGKISLPEYYSSELYNPDFSTAEKKEFVGRKGSYLINARLSPLELTYSRVFVSDKVMYTALLCQLGMLTTETQAVVSSSRHFGDIPALRDAASVRDFLENKAVFPIFGKPCDGRGSVGSALFTGSENGQLLLGNGQTVDLDAFCAEVFRDYPDGFIFQTALVQHDTLSKVTGSAVGTLRIVTIRDTAVPRTMYTVWKIPSPSAMSDNFWQSGSMVAQVNDAGQVGKCRVGTGLDGQYIETHPVSGARFDEVQIPHWEAAQKLATRAHALFPEFGIVGWDMAITPEGPTIVECNDNPFHVLWQLANGRGINNADFTPAMDAAADLSEFMLDEKNRLFRERERLGRS